MKTKLMAKLFQAWRTKNEIYKDRLTLSISKWPWRILNLIDSKERWRRYSPTIQLSKPKLLTSETRLQPLTARFILVKQIQLSRSMLKTSKKLKYSTWRNSFRYSKRRTRSKQLTMPSPKRSLLKHSRSLRVSLYKLKDWNHWWRISIKTKKNWLKDCSQLHKKREMRFLIMQFFKMIFPTIRGIFWQRIRRTSIWSNQLLDLMLLLMKCNRS